MQFKEAIAAFQNNNDRTIIDRIIAQLDTDYLALRVETDTGYSIELDEPEQYIAYRIKAQIMPYLRKARSVRNGTKTRWYRFMDLINGDDYYDDGYVGINKTYGLNLSRENNYAIPQSVRDSMSDGFLEMVEEEIDFFNELHRKEDEIAENLFNEALCNLAIPALEYALIRVDVGRTDKEVVSYINRAFLTKYVELRAKSQGLVRKRVNGHWVYYEPQQEFDEDNYKNQRIMEIIFKREDFIYPKRWDRVKLLTQPQFLLIDRIEAVIRADIRRNDSAYFMKNYNHGKMKYKYMAEQLGMNYDAFIKNMQRIEARIFNL
jgi:hypothetical protein